jgi:hypothetical protein
MSTSFDLAQLDQPQTFSVKGPASQLAQYSTKQGRMSPVGEIPLKKGDAGRKLLRIPDDAHFWAWCFGLDSDHAPAQPSSDLDLFLMHGGLACWNKSGGFAARGRR